MSRMDQTTPDLQSDSPVPLPIDAAFGYVPIEPPKKTWWQKFKAAWFDFYDKVDAVFSQKQVVTIGSMEIDITPIFDAIAFPFRLIGRLFSGKKARSRRGGSSGRMSDAEKSLQRLKILRLLAIFGLLSIIIGITSFFGLFAWYSRDLPQPGQVIRREGFSTKFYDRNGELLYDLFSSERRNPVSIEDVPEHLKQATIAIEDKDFYKHKGFDMLTFLRIPYNIVFRGRVVGGSTLTQQLVKNVLLTNERTISRKFKEFVLALQIERTFSKDQILEMYLNEAPYGGTAWGVGAATEIYFDKPVSELTVAESAILAGLPQRPSAYSPITGKMDEETGEPLWKVRAQGVLWWMRELEYISEIEYTEALSELDSMTFEKSQVAVKAPHYVFYVRDQLEELFGEDIVERGGLKVTTSLDLELHSIAQEVVAEEVADMEDYDVTNGSAMVMDPRTGEILSMVGSRDYFSEDIDGQFNVAVDGLRQPGSSIKPVTYLSLFERGYHPSSMLMDVDTTFAQNDIVDPYQPRNYNGKFNGPVSIRKSLGSSLNIPAVKALGIVGLEDFLNQAYSMGFVTFEPNQENLQRFGLSITLGGGEVHLIDTVSAYSAFANGGTRVEPVSILKVEDGLSGNVLYEHRYVEGPQVVSPEGAFLINDVLSDNSARALAFGANSLLNLSPNIAVKTGTTNLDKDNWAIGWSQEVIVGAWVGNNDNASMNRIASGVSGASPIWRRIMQAALEAGYEAPEWQVPDGVEKVNVDSISGYPSHDEYPSHEEYVIKGSLPTGPDPVHAKLKLCRGENKLANEARVAVGDFDEKEFIVLREDDPVSEDGKNRWQEAINAWINGQEDERYKVPTEYCGEESDISITLRHPNHETKYNEQEVEVEVEAGSGDGIEKIEIIVNGEVKKTVDNSRFKEKINFGTGRFEVWAKAYSRGGKQKESNKVKIGTGGQDWKEPEPSPTPSPTPTPSPSPSPSVAPSVEPTPSPSASPESSPTL